MQVRGRWGVNLSLLVVVLVLGTFALMRPGKKEGEHQSPLLNLDLKALQSLTLENGEHIEFESPLPADLQTVLDGLHSGDIA